MAAAHDPSEDRASGSSAGVAPLAAFASETWGFLQQSTDLWLSSVAGPDGIRARATHRLNSLVAHARRNSRYYAELYRDLPAGRSPLAQLPVVNKRDLMARFNDWVTVPELTLSGVREFLCDPHKIGKPYLGQYAIWTSSGTNGSPGIFVQDPRALSVYEALFAVRAGVDGRAMLRAVSGNSRFAFAAATEGHFAGITMWKRMRQMNPWMSRHSRAISVLQSTSDLCSQLGAFDPEILTSYASELVVLAEEQRAGRLDLRLKGIWSGGETLSRRDHANIAGAFGCPVVDDYGASEFLNIAYDCGCGALHLNRDWVILEAVDREGHPVPDGTPSDTVLLTNLANYVQPIIRYDLGDSVTYLTEPCPCGNALPAIRVEGRRDDSIFLVRPDGRPERVVPLALCTAIEERTGVYRFQVTEEATNRLSLRIDPAEGDALDTSTRVAQCLHDYFAERGVNQVSLHTDPAPPLRSAGGGKIRRVCARPDAGAGPATCGPAGP